jgi:ATP-dependent DNA ligase
MNCGTGRLPFTPPVRPMLARLARTLPVGDGYVFEPKWDGFRCLAFRTGPEVELFSRHERPLTRYFPEIVDALRRLGRERLVLDGELMIPGGDSADFGALMARLHPAPSRVERLRRETPACFAAFDILALEGDDLRTWPFWRRRAVLEDLLTGPPPELHLTPITSDRALAESWLKRPGSGIDGVVAKHRDLHYEPGRRSMVKVKQEHTLDCVVGGFRLVIGEPSVASLLLGLYDDAGQLGHVGVAASFTTSRRHELVYELAPYVSSLEGHPWERGFLLGGGRLGHLPGSAGRWAPGDERDWIPVRPELVCEVAYDIWEGDRFRHAARFRRWRPDREAGSCTFAQTEPVGT